MSYFWHTEASLNKDSNLYLQILQFNYRNVNLTKLSFISISFYDFLNFKQKVLIKNF